MLRQVVFLLVVYTASAQLIQNQKLRFKISARGLPDKDDGFGTSDPYVEVYYTENGSDKETKIGRTATINDDENPNWGDVFEFQYDRSKGQRFYFKVYDHDNLREDDSVGKAWVVADDYVDKGQTYTVNLSKKGSLTIASADPVQQVVQVQQPQVVQVQQPVQPQLVQVQQPVQPQVIHVQQPQVVAPVAPVLVQQPQVVQPQQVIVQQPVQTTRRIKFQLSARGLPDTDLVGTVDPYVKVFYTDSLRSSETLLGRTAPIQNEENPNWKEVLEFDYVPGNKQKWRFMVLDEDENRRDDEVGTANLDVDQYVSSGENTIINLSKGQLIVKRV